MPADYYYLLEDVHKLAKVPYTLPAKATLATDEILARTAFTAVSPGTELAAWSGMEPLRPMKVYPRYQGYANIAEVLATGADVKGVKTGDYVLTQYSHRSAFVCKEADLLASFSENESELARYTTTYFFHLGYYPYLRAGLTGMQSVTVIGLGMIGLTAMAMGALMGHRVIGISDAVNGDWLAQTGAERAFKRDAFREAQDYFAPMHGAAGADLVILTTNGWDDWKLALECTRVGGTIALVGFPGRGQGDAPFNPLASQYVYDKQLTLVHCGNPPDVDCSATDLRHTLKRNCAAIVERIRSGKLRTDYLTEAVYPAGDLEVAYRALSSRPRSSVSAILDWKGERDA